MPSRKARDSDRRKFPGISRSKCSVYPGNFARRAMYLRFIQFVALSSKLCQTCMSSVSSL